MSDTIAGPGYTLTWVGAQRRLLAGDLTPCADLRDLAGLPHTYAVGPLAGLRGEVTLIDGAPLGSTISAGSVRVEQSFAHEACFLVHAQVPRWQWLANDGILPSWPALGPALRRAAEGCVAEAKLRAITKAAAELRQGF